MTGPELAAMPPARVPRTLALDAIDVGERVRSGLGDVPALADSIAEVGVLHSLVVTADGRLVAGGRRLAAVRSLGWAEVPVTVVELNSVADVLRGEMAENTARLDFSPVEAALGRQRVAAVLAPVAADRVRGRGQRADTASNLDEVSTARATRKLAAVGTGYSGSTLDTVRHAAERETVRHAGREVTVAPAVREVALSAAEELRQPGAKVDAAHRRVCEAIETLLDDSALRLALWHKRFLAEVDRAGRLVAWPSEDIAANADARARGLYDEVIRHLVAQHARMTAPVITDATVTPLIRDGTPRTTVNADAARQRVTDALGTRSPARAPAPGGRRRRPLPEAFRDAEHDLGKAVERLARLVADDRFPSHRGPERHLGTGLLARHLRMLTDVVDAVGSPAVRDAPEGHAR